MVIFICYWADYTQGKTKLRRKSENAVACDFFDAETDHTEDPTEAVIQSLAGTKLLTYMHCTP